MKKNLTSRITVQLFMDLKSNIFLFTISRFGIFQNRVVN